jgi:hypothetical protein
MAIVMKRYEKNTSEEITDDVIKEITKVIDDELEKTLREYVGGLRPQIIESYYEGYREALKKLKKELLE